MINLTFETPTLPRLSDEQERAIDHILAWMRSDRREFRLSGLAGTGKTTILEYLYRFLDANVVVASYTGKAVATLRKRGIKEAITLHRLLYYSSYSRRKHSWTQRQKHRIDRHDVVFVDEASMVTDQIRADLLAKAQKVLFVGDPGQLEPIGGGTPFMEHADRTLTEIHRQAQDNPIIRFSHRLRHGLPYTFGTLDRLQILPLATYKEIDLSAFDIVACGLNATRIRINREIRKRKGLTDSLCVGDRVVCLENDSAYHVFNGEAFQIAALGEPAHDRNGSLIIEAQIIDEAQEDRGCIPISMEALGGSTPKGDRRERDGLLFDFAQCLTTHKLQASEYDRVLGIDEPPGSCDPKRWRYTMSTRAIDRLTFLTNYVHSD